MEKKIAALLDESDHRALQLADERLGRLQAQASLLLEQDGIAAKIRTAEATRVEVINRLASDYDAAGGRFDIDSGKVTRKPKLAAVE